MPSVQHGDGRWSHTFSASGLKSYLVCPEQGRRQYHKLMPWKSNEITTLGRAVHSGFEASLKEDLGPTPALRVAQHAFADGTLEPGFEWVKYSPEQVALYIECHMASFYKEVRPKLGAVQAVEEPFDLPLHEDPFRTIRLRGIIDCVTADDVIDWKTAGSPHKVWEVERYAIQPTVYTWAWSQISGENRDALRYVVFVHGKGIQDYKVVRVPTAIEWLKFQAIQFARLIESDLPFWTMNDQGWHCAEKWCGAWSDCKGKYLEGGENGSR